MKGPRVRKTDMEVENGRGKERVENEGQGGSEKGIDVSVRGWWGVWAPINRRAAAPHLSTLPEINKGSQIGI